jgi:hypothetical protein
VGAFALPSIENAYIELKKHLGMDLEEIQMVDYIQQLPYLDEALLERFGVDFRMVQLPAATAPDLISLRKAITMPS